MSNDTPTAPNLLARTIDTRIPLVWLLTIAGALAWFLITNYFGQQELAKSQVRLGEEISELKVIVRSGNATSGTITGEMALLKFRVENLESERRNASSQRPGVRP